MFPLKTILIGGDERALPRIRAAIRAHTSAQSAEYPNAESAIPAMRGSADKHLFLVLVQSERDITGLHRLANAFAGQAILAIVDDEAADLVVGSTQQALIFRAMRAGATQVVTTPIDDADLAQGMDCLAMHFGGFRSGGKVVAVSGVTGGCGATTLAVNLAHEVAFLGKQEVILAETEMRIGMLASYLDLNPTHTIGELFQLENVEVNQVRQILTPVCQHLSAACGHFESFRDDDVSPDRLFDVVHLLAQMASTVVLDVPCTMGYEYFEILSRANHVVLVAEQTLPSMRNLRMVSEAIQSAEAVESVSVVVNKYDAKVRGFSAQALRDLLKLSQIWTVENDHAVVAGAINAGRPIRLCAPQSKVLRDIDVLASDLVACPLEPEAGKSGVRRLFDYIFAES